jgi:predicted permease
MPNFAGVGADLRFTARLFRKSPGFSLISIASMALGIGASSAIFSLVYAVLLDPYPYKNADRIVAPAYSDKQGPRGTIFYTIQDFLELRQNSKTLEDVFLADQRPFVSTGSIPEQVRGVAYSPNAFEFMGVPALLGRAFTPEDLPAPQVPPRIAVISYLFWLRHFNRDPGVVGKALELDHQHWTVIGVLPPRFTWNDADVYVPLAMISGPNQIATMARIKPGIALEAASAELQAMTERFAKRSPDVYPKEFHFKVQPLNDWLLGKFEGTLLILLSAVGFLLLIACGNVSILLLARAGARQKEIAVRLSLGAGRGRILQQLLTESVLLSLTGGIIGIGLAYVGVPLLVSLMPEYSVPHEAAIQVNRAVVLFTFAIAVLTGILFGMAPALQLAKADMRDAMQETGRGFAGSSGAGKTRSILIVAEVALTMVLLVGAGVAIRGFIELTQTRLGFDPTNVLTFQMNLPAGSYKTWDARAQHFHRILDKLQSTPGVLAASGTFTAMPPRIGFRAPFEIPGRAKDPTWETQIGLVGGDYFGALRIPLVLGRAFSQFEMTGSRRVGIINEEMLRRYWPTGGAIGSQVVIPNLDLKGAPEVFVPPNAADPIEIVGVVATARNGGLLEPARPAIYVPWTALIPPSSAFLVRTQADPHKLVNAIREQVRAIDPDEPLIQVQTLEEGMSRFETAYPRFSMTLFSIFAAVALLLAASGIYSVVAYVVARRTHEFGIRMALGANRGDVLGLVVRMTARLMVAGIAIGLGCSLALSRVIANYVSGWHANDPAAFIGVTVTLSVAALLASWFPARRAVAIQPMQALRHE